MLASLLLATVVYHPQVRLAFRPAQTVYRYELVHSYKDPDDGELLEKLTWSEQVWVKGDGDRVQLDRRILLKEHLLSGEKLDLPKDHKETKTSEVVDQRGYRTIKFGVNEDPLQYRLNRLLWTLLPERPLDFGERWELKEPGLPERGVPIMTFMGVFEGSDLNAGRPTKCRLNWSMIEDDYGMSVSGTGVFDQSTGMPFELNLKVSNARMAGNSQTKFDLEVSYRLIQ